MKRDDYVRKPNETVKAFETQRDKMDEILTRIYDLGQLAALDALVLAVDSGIWSDVTYKGVVAIRDALKQLMDADNNIQMGGEELK